MRKCPQSKPKRSWLWTAVGYLWAMPVTLFAIGIGLLLLSRFRCVDGAIEMHGPGISWVLRRMPVPAAAMTMGHAIFGCDRQALDRTRRHEHVHVRQYAKLGILFIPAYLSCSAWLYLRGRDAYRENPFEVEAYAIDDPSKRH